MHVTESKVCTLARNNLLDPVMLLSNAFPPCIPPTHAAKSAPWLAMTSRRSLGCDDRVNVVTMQ